MESIPQGPGADDLDMTGHIEQGFTKPLTPEELPETLESLSGLFENITDSFDEKTPEEQAGALSQLAIRVEELNEDTTRRQYEGNQLARVQAQQELSKRITDFIRQHQQ